MISGKNAQLSDYFPALALAAALPMALGSLPPFTFGQWEKAEPLLVWFHASAALAALAVAYGLWRRPKTTRDRVSHPFVLLPLALGLYSAATAPLQELPWISLLGAPQSGYGALWFLDTAAFTACALLAAQHQRGWMALGRWAIAVTFVVTALKTWDWFSLQRGGSTLLIFVPAYYGWLALGLPVAVGRPYRWIALAAALAIAIASNSFTILAVVLGGLVFVAASNLQHPLARWLTSSRAAATAWVVASAALPLLAVQFFPILRHITSIQDRFLLQRMMGAALANDPGAIVLGHGWGRTQDVFQTWLNVTGERLWNPSWIFLSSDYFHSHNWAVEALYASGLPGLLLMLAGFVAIPFFAAEDRRPVATAFAMAVTIIHGLWFPLCLSIPIIAMAMAALADRTTFPCRLPHYLPGFMTIVLALGQAMAAGALLTYGVAINEARLALTATPPRAVTIPTDLRGSDLAVAEMMVKSTASLASRIGPEQMQATTKTLPPFIDFIDNRFSETKTILLLTAGLETMTRVYVTGDFPFMQTPENMSKWRRWLDRLLQIAPGRTDQAIPYLSAALAQGKFADVDRLTTSILARNPHDPVGLNYRGLLTLVTGGDRGGGLKMIRSALDNGLDRFMPIDPAVMLRFGMP